MDTMFMTFAGQQLHADTDAEEGTPHGNHLLLQNLAHAFDGVQAIAAILEGADTGQNKGSRIVNGLRRSYYPGSAAGFLKSFLNASQIAHAVVDDRDHGLPSSLDLSDAARTARISAARTPPASSS